MRMFDCIFFFITEIEKVQFKMTNSCRSLRLAFRMKFLSTRIIVSCDDDDLYFSRVESGKWNSRILYFGRISTKQQQQQEQQQPMARINATCFSFFFLMKKQNHLVRDVYIKKCENIWFELILLSIRIITVSKMFNVEDFGGVDNVILFRIKLVHDRVD